MPNLGQPNHLMSPQHENAPIRVQLQQQMLDNSNSSSNNNYYSINNNSYNFSKEEYIKIMEQSVIIASSFRSLVLLSALLTNIGRT
jgi:hypothetical protein